MEPRKTVMLLGLILVMGAMPAVATMTPAETEADDRTAATRAPDAGEAAADIGAVMAGEDFAHRTQRHELRLKPAIRDWLKKLGGDRKPAHSGADGTSFWNSVARVISWIIGHLLWILAFAVLLAAFLSRRHWLPWLQRRPAARPQPHKARLSPEAGDEVVILPADVATEARARWQAGDARAALSLLYRGASRSLGLPDHQTEGENLALVRRARSPDLTDGYEHITRAWRDLAWARRLPADFPGLCATYDRYFSGGDAS